MTVREWVEYWQAKYDALAVRRTSYEAHRYVLENHIIPGLGERELTELTSNMIEDFLAQRKADGNRRNGGPLSEVTVGHIWRLLTYILDRAVEEGRLVENPARAFQYPTVRKVKAETRTDQEIEDYLGAAGELGYLPIFLLALEQGLRQRDLIALKWSDLDVEKRTLPSMRDGRWSAESWWSVVIGRERFACQNSRWNAWSENTKSTPAVKSCSFIRAR